MNKLFLLLLLIIILSMPGAKVSAQETDPHSQPKPIQLKRLIDKQPKSPVIDKIERLMRMRRFEAAAELGEIQLNMTPDDIHLKRLLSNCYKESNNFDKLATLIRRRLTNEPPGFKLYHDAGEAYLLSGKPDSARHYFFQAIPFILNNPVTLEIIAHQYQTFGRYDLLSEFIDSMRVLTEQPDLLPGRMGDALAAQKYYARATMEYLTYMQKDTASALNGENKLVSMIRYPESTDTVMAILANQIQQQIGSHRLVNTYGQLLMEQDRFEDSRIFFQKMDSLRNSKGNDILYFMSECNRRGEFSSTIKAGEYFADNYEFSPIIATAQFAMAEAYTELQQYNEALGIYKSASEIFPRSAQRADAYLKIGTIYKDFLNDFPKAETYFNIVRTSAPKSFYAIRAEYESADLLIKKNQFDSALALCNKILEQNIRDDFAEKTEFLQARIHLFLEKFKDAGKIFQQIISRYPKGYYVNDAIQYSLILTETVGSVDEHMDLYSAAEYHNYCGNTDSLEFYLDKICRIEIDALAPVSYLKLAQLHNSQQKYQIAINDIDSLETKYFNSYFYPYGLKLKADIFMESMEKSEESISIYRDLLEEFPTYPFSGEIRKILRQKTELN